MKLKNKKHQNKTKKFNSKNNDALDDLEENYEEQKKWYEGLAEDPKDVPKVTEQVLIDLKDEAKKYHDAEVASYNIKNSKANSNFNWMKTVMSSGTVSDKIAAHTVAIQDQPICNLETIRNMVNMVKVGKKKECTAVIETLTEIFLNDILLPDRKLRPFHSRPLSQINELSSGNTTTKKKLLILWYFEDQIKEVYTSFVLALNRAAQDTVESNKDKAITAMFKLLSGNPEQEKNLLAYIVNKLGDPLRKIASKTIYCLTKLLFKHPNMQEVVLGETEKLLFRPNISTRAQYYSLCFLSQYYLSVEASNVARKLIEVYFAFFKACVKKGDVDTRMMSVLLMGLNRAYPYAKLDLDKMSEHIDTMYKLVHLANFNISIQALSLLFQVCADNVTDRFYSALYRKLTDPQLLITTYQAMFLSLVYKALLRDKEIQRIKMFIKRLLQVALYVQPNFACGILYLISQLLSKNAEVSALVIKEPKLSEELEDDSEEKYYDIKDEELEQIKIEDDDKSQSLNISNVDLTHVVNDDVKPEIDTNLGSSWCHKDLVKTEKHRPIVKYNPLCRNPLYGGGEYCVYTELMYLKDSFHPTVALYANNILSNSGNIATYSGDPLQDFTLIRFLERFVFKNPKRVEGKTGAHPTFGKRKMYKPSGMKLLAVNSSSYLNERQENVPVDELFMYRYLQNRYENRKIKDEDDESDVESVQSEEFDDMLEKMSGVKDIDDEDIDYMNEITQSINKTTKNKKKKDNDDVEGDSEDDLEEQDSEDDLDDDFEEETEEDRELFGDIDEDSEEDIEFDSEDNDEALPQTKMKKSKKNSMDSIFASADEFATLLEEEGSSKVKPGSSNVYSNMDNAANKQLAWEDKRNRWLQGFNKAVSGKGNADFSRKSHKRKGGNKFDNNRKKFKK